MISQNYNSTDPVILYNGDCLDFLNQIEQSGDEPRLILTSPPYNLNKEYENTQSLQDYLEFQTRVIEKCVSILAEDGSICWQVGHYIKGTGRAKQVYPLDIMLFPIFWSLGLNLKNRIIWTYGHGLHDKTRFSGRHETILWFTKSDNYVFNLDPIRIPQKYPNKKYFRGKRKGELSGNPLGKNPGDVWEITNVKNNHPEKTVHPCQYPTDLVKRLVLALTNEGDLVVDPFVGSGTTAVVCSKLNRRVAGSDINSTYIEIAKERLLTNN